MPAVAIEADFSYLGSFLGVLPNANIPLEAGGGSRIMAHTSSPRIAFNPDRQSLYVSVGGLFAGAGIPRQRCMVAEIGIPTLTQVSPANRAARSVAGLQRGTLKQNYWRDVAQGLWGVDPAITFGATDLPVTIYGMEYVSQGSDYGMPSGPKLIVNAGTFYNTSSFDLSLLFYCDPIHVSGGGNPQGPWRVTGVNHDHVIGGVTKIPVANRGYFDNNHFLSGCVYHQAGTGQNQSPFMSCAWRFTQPNPTKWGQLPGKLLALRPPSNRYMLDPAILHPLTGSPGTQGQASYFDGCYVHGANKHAVVTVVSYGVEQYYGDALPADRPWPGPWCAAGTKGWHSDPYTPAFVITDPAEYQAVAAGTKTYQQVVHSSYFDSTFFMYSTCNGYLGGWRAQGSAFDPATGRIFVAQATNVTNETFPGSGMIFHVLQFNDSPVDPDPPDPPPAPTGRMSIRRTT